MQINKPNKSSAKEYKMSAGNSKGTTLLVSGRIVWHGNMFEGKVRTNQTTKQPIINTKTGKPEIEFALGLAVPKAQAKPFLDAILAEAQQVYPNQLPPNFAYKFKDGDGVDNNGKALKEKTGYEGCYVFTLSTRIAPKCFIFEGGTNVLVREGIKSGDYVTVQVGIQAHPAASATSVSGMYLNPLAVQRTMIGEAIVGAQVSGDDIFGVQAPVIPQGAQAPLAPAFPMQPAQPTQPHYQVLPPNMQPQGQPAQAPVSNVPAGFPFPQR